MPKLTDRAAFDWFWGFCMAAAIAGLVAVGAMGANALPF